jgi:long-chain acyl-CoA synthetase
MAESLTEFFLANFQAHRTERAYGQRRGYRMEWFTYGQVMELALGFRDELAEHKIAKGDRVMLWGENSAEWVAAFFGCALAGAILVPMDNSAPPDFAMRVAQQVEAKLWICSRQHAAEGAAPAVPVLLLEEIKIPALTLQTAQGQGRGDRGATDVPIGREDTLEIVFTSGTTAEPKGVVITHGNVLANVAPLDRGMKPYLKYERWVHPVRFLNLLPLSHVFGQFLGMFLPPLLGGTVIFQEELKPAEIVGTIRRERVSVLVSVPRVLQSLKQKIERDVESEGRLEDFERRFRTSKGQHFLRRWWTFRSIRSQFGWKFWAFICGGAALDSETEEFWDRLGYAAIQGYGLTETTSLISVNHPFKLGRGSIGKVLPGRELKLAEDGEILVRGGGVAAAIWDKNGRRAVVDSQGWYRTGDVGALDESGNLYFKGRKKDVIVTPAGLNIYPEDLEAALRRQPEVKDCVVVGMEREGNAEPCAVVILRGDDVHNEARLEDAVARANQSLAEFQRMRMCLRWPQEDFPRTSTQKPRRNLIAEFAAKQLLRSGQPAEREAPENRSAVLEMIGRITKRNVTGLNATKSDSDLQSDLGLSSLDRVELIGALEDRYQVDLSETRFSAARTVSDIERMINGNAAERVAYHYPRWVLRWPVTWLRWLAHHLLMRPAVMLLGWPRIEGRENLRGWSGPLLVVCNHIGDVDVGFVQTALPARLRHRLATATGGEALENLRTPPQGKSWLARTYDHVEWTLGVSLLNLYPLPREAGFRKSFAYAGEAVDRGYSILIFPEGKHTVDGKMNPFRTGIGLLANNLNLPVLPMRILGLFEVKQAGRKFAWPREITVRIGTPIKFAPESGPAQIAQELQSAVERL